MQVGYRSYTVISVTTINRHAVQAFAAARGVKTAQLAREIDMDRTVLSSALNAGTRRIPAEKLLPLAEALMVDPRALLGPDIEPVQVNGSAA